MFVSFRGIYVNMYNKQVIKLCFFYKNLYTIFFYRDIDQMLYSLGVAPVSEVLSSISSVNSMTSDNSNTQTPDASLQTNLNGVS